MESPFQQSDRRGRIVDWKAAKSTNHPERSLRLREDPFHRAMNPIQRHPPVPRPSSVAQAFEQYTPRLHQYLRRLLRDPRRASDVVQETFKRFIGRTERSEAIQDPL